MAVVAGFLKLLSFCMAPKPVSSSARKDSDQEEAPRIAEAPRITMRESTPVPTTLPAQTAQVVNQSMPVPTGPLGMAATGQVRLSDSQQWSSTPFPIHI
mmetsp:Transcript_51768/g.82255  ORF Transcript_51768/g.82255 Transcript_51768/m.82255 type:complete len:99 (-) Transcript_51768:121-417(-)